MDGKEHVASSARQREVSILSSWTVASTLALVCDGVAAFQPLELTTESTAESDGNKSRCKKALARLICPARAVQMMRSLRVRRSSERFSSASSVQSWAVVGRQRVKLSLIVSTSWRRSESDVGMLAHRREMMFREAEEY